AAAASHAVAIYLFCWGFFTFYLWIASFKTNVAVFLVFLTLWVAFGLLGWGDLGGGHYVAKDIGGAVTISCAVLAWYLASAEVINETWGRTVLPLGPLNT
ncbi:MAG: acetate uptake transporter, partial [Solirubrobacteraceae bacterium]